MCVVCLLHKAVSYYHIQINGSSDSVTIRGSEFSNEDPQLSCKDGVSAQLDIPWKNGSYSLSLEFSVSY